jgi:hypothetical protein
VKVVESMTLDKLASRKNRLWQSERRVAKSDFNVVTKKEFITMCVAWRSLCVTNVAILTLLENFFRAFKEIKYNL